VHRDGPTLLQLIAVPVRAAAPGPGKGRERSDLAASRPTLIVPDLVDPSATAGWCWLWPLVPRPRPPKWVTQAARFGLRCFGPEQSRLVIEFAAQQTDEADGRRGPATAYRWCSADRESMNGQGIEVLHGLEAVRRRPEMYLASLDTANVADGLLFEALCHAFDEALDGACTEIEIVLRGAQATIEYDAGLPLCVSGTTLSAHLLLATL